MFCLPDFTEGMLPDKLYKTVEVEVLGYEPSVLESYEWYILTAASHLGIEVGRVWTPRKSEKDRFSLLKSVHIFKKHQVQYEVRTYHKFFTFRKLTGSTASTYLEYIQRNIPEGVAMKVTKVEVLPKPDFLKDHTK
jgi:small subunit ribosomal protein S10